MEIRFGDFVISIPYENLLKLSMENPFSTMFLKFNKEFFKALNKRASIDYANYFEEYKKWMEKFVQISKPDKREEWME